MKSLLLASAVFAAVVSAAAPAAAQFASTGDGIFGHDYRAEQAKRRHSADVRLGYTEEAAPVSTGSVRAVETDRREQPASARTTAEDKADPDAGAIRR